MERDPLDISNKGDKLKRLTIYELSANEKELSNKISNIILKLKESINDDNNLLYSEVIKMASREVSDIHNDRQLSIILDSMTNSLDISDEHRDFLPSAIAICLNLTYPYKKESKLTLELKEILDNNDMTRYDIWLSLVRSGIQIVECYEGITGYVKKQQLKESLLQIIDGLEGDDKKIVMGYYNNTLDPTISAIIDAWKAKSPNRKWCFMCF